MASRINSRTIQGLFSALLVNPNAQAGLASFLTGANQTVQDSLSKGDTPRAQRVVGALIQLAPLIAAAALANTPAEQHAEPEAVQEAKQAASASP